MHTVFDDFTINSKFLPEHHCMQAHLCLEYRPDGQGFTFGQEPDETREPARNNRRGAASSSAQAQGNLPAAREEIKDQPEVINIDGKEYTMDVKVLNLHGLS